MVRLRYSLANALGFNLQQTKAFSAFWVPSPVVAPPQLQEEARCLHDTVIHNCAALYQGIPPDPDFGDAVTGIVKFIASDDWYPLKDEDKRYVELALTQLWPELGLKPGDLVTSLVNQHTGGKRVLTGMTGERWRGA